MFLFVNVNVFISINVRLDGMIYGGYFKERNVADLGSALSPLAKFSV